jgi:hypothetical protein
MSGLSHTPGKRARGYTLRGFESRLLRQQWQTASKSPINVMFMGLFLPKNRKFGDNRYKPLAQKA